MYPGPAARARVPNPRPPAHPLRFMRLLRTLLILGLLLPSGSASAARLVRPAAQDAVDDGARAIEEITADFHAAQARFNKAVRGAKTKKERNQITRELRPEVTDFTKRLWDVAEANQGTSVEWEALHWIFRQSGTERTRALEAIVARHLAQPELLDLVPQLTVRGEKTRALVRKIGDEAQDRRVRGLALMHVATYWKRLSDRGVASAAARAEELCDRLLSDYRDVSHRRQALQSFAQDTLWELRNLGIGMVAPEIEGEDIDGVSFRLSDYRGKVVVLDFWGDW